MIPFIYFYPDISNRQEIPTEDIWRFDEGCKTRGATGPDKQRGLLVSPFGEGELEYNQETHIWQKMGPCSLGVAKGLKPEDLLRKDALLRGYSVKLADGNQWTIPAAYLQGENFSLPTYETMNEERQWTRSVDEKYEHLTHFASMFWDKISDNGDIEFDDEDQLRNICCSVLSVNYNISTIEAAALKIFSNEAYVNIIKALVDLEGRIQIFQHIEGKKKLSEAEDTNFGEPD